MGGGNVSYQLRPNKHIERLMFVEMLGRVCASKPTAYTYVSMGGPQLEDHKLLHQDLGITSLFSFEEDDVVYQRQLFNQRPSCIKCLQKPISDFVENFDRFVDEESLQDKKLIVWLDYASPNRREQLIEYETLLSKLSSEDIVKITLNANPNTLGEKQSGESQDSLFNRRLKNLSEQIGEYLSPDVTSDDMTGKRLVPILASSLEIAAEKGTKNDNRITPLLLSLFSYQDSDHLMLTATIRITNKSDVESYKNNIQSWEYVPNSWVDIKKINIPSLSAKEKLEIDSKLPTDDFETLHKNLPFRLHTDEKTSLELLIEYAQHYRRYPSYFQVIL